MRYGLVILTINHEIKLQTNVIKTQLDTVHGVKTLRTYYETVANIESKFTVYSLQFIITLTIILFIFNISILN